MERRLSSSIYVRSLSVFCCMTLLGLQYAAAETTDRATGFQLKDIDEKSIGLWENGQPVLVYNTGLRSLPGNPAAGRRSSYVHPLYGLNGEILTDDFPPDHYHHHGLFWGWPHVKIGKRDYDLWKMRGIRIDIQRWITQQAEGNRAVLSLENGWFVGDRRVMKEVVTLKVHPRTAEGREIDIRFQWTPTENAITLGGAEGKGYGGLTLRFAPRKETTITVPSGQTKEDLLSTRLPWADLSAKFQDASSASGAALMVDPEHPNFPPYWMTREYGVLAVGWPGDEPRTLGAGETVDCSYRVWIHNGSPTAAEIQHQYDAFRRASDPDKN